MNCHVYLILKHFLLVIVLALNLALLATKDYFSIKPSGSAYFGLNSVTYYSSTFSYSNFSLICTDSLSSHKICSNLQNLNKAGEIFKIFIAFDILTLIIYTINSFLEQISLKKTVKVLLTNNKPSKILKLSLVCSNRLRLIFILHPVFIILGVGLWIEIANIDKFSNDMHIESGLIVMIFQSFFSLMTTAGFLWEMSDMKRRNLKKMKGGEKKSADKGKNCLDNVDLKNKGPSFDVTWDEKMMRGYI